ncbi:hypothetical protein FB451DRAFT_1410327 [Mycena latifolia]|nr:hypothetical protein FB451DRAFT_1410327 [Mycena latifolia]
MRICKFFRRFSFRTARVVPATKATDGNDRSSHSKESPDPGDIQHRLGHPAGLHTNVLTATLRTLSSVSSNVPFGSLSSVIEPLLDITGCNQQVSANAQGLTELAARIELITPIVSDMATNKPEEGRAFVESLRRELESIMKDLSDAHAQGKLEQFFNSAGDASSLAKHNMTLAQMIADSTLVTIQDILKTLHDIEHSKLQESPHELKGAISQVRILFQQSHTLYNPLAGGLGSMGVSGRVGGEGGEGEGPELELTLDEHLKVGNISGGTGGTGGAGIEVGGKGGSGKAPIIRVQRRRNPAVILPQ